MKQEKPFGIRVANIGIALMLTLFSLDIWANDFNTNAKTVSGEIAYAASAIDTDGDGVPDATDNCPFASNADQQDSGGFNTSVPDGIGDACQCGDVNSNGIVNSADAVIIKRYVHGLPPGVDLDKCNVSSDNSCTSADAVIIKRAIHGLPPGLSQSCTAATAEEDTVAPSAPGNLRTASTPSSSQVSITWDASTDNIGVDGYRVYRDNTLLSTTTSLTYSDTSVAANAIYQYSVEAFDAANNTATSSILSVNTPAEEDTVAPSTPGNLRTASTPTSSQVSITWDASTDNVGVAGYRVYRDSTLLSTTTSLSYSDTTVSEDSSYQYMVEAFDAANNSTSSEVLSVSTPPTAQCQSCTPIILYTDIVAGPSSGGEGNNGAYLSIFGINFGNASDLGNTTKLYINDQEVARYIYIGEAKSQFMPNHKTVQQISVQIGSIGGSPAGENLPIKLVVDGKVSNLDKTFMIQPGNILYVSNVNGNDSTAIKDDITRPWRYVQTPGFGGALEQVQPGDFVVMREGVWSDVGYGSNRFVRIRASIDGTKPNGQTGNGYITIMGYPGEDVHFIPQSNTYGGFHGVSNDSSTADYIVIANLRIEGGDRTVGDAPINMQADSDNWRIVNNEIFDWIAEDGSQGTQAKAGGIVGNGVNINIIGNYIHGIGGGTKNHGIYLDTGASNVDIAYNHISDVTGGNIIQTFDNLGTDNLNNINIHHNRIHGTTRYGVNISGGTDTANVWNNVIYDTDFAGIRLACKSPSSVLIYHNTLYNTNRNNNRGPFANNDRLDTGLVRFANNIVYPNSNATSYVYADAVTTALSVENNLWYGLSSGIPGYESSPVGDGTDGQAPGFTSINVGDFSLQATSVAIDAATTLPDLSITTDFVIAPRTMGVNPDIGAFELAP